MTTEPKCSSEVANTLGARFYAPALGRFLTPDWSDTPEPIPYADLGDPQTLNLYEYGGNNPVSNTDPDGHVYIFDHAFFGGSCAKTSKLPVKEGGAAVIPADGTLDVSAILESLQGMADAATVGAAGLVSSVVFSSGSTDRAGSVEAFYRQ